MHGLLATWAVVLSKHSGQDDVVMGVPYANRGAPETQGVIGYFINTLAVRVRLGSEASFSSLLSAARQGMLDAMVHGDVPFVEVAKACATMLVT